MGEKIFWKPYSAKQMQNIIGSGDHMFALIFGIYAVSPLKICKLRTLSLMHLDLILVIVLRKQNLQKDFFGWKSKLEERGRGNFWYTGFTFDPASFLKAQSSDRMWERSYLSATPPEVVVQTTFTHISFYWWILALFLSF